jgi:hypothetical protein
MWAFFMSKISVSGFLQQQTVPAIRSFGNLRGGDLGRFFLPLFDTINHFLRASRNATLKSKKSQLFGAIA